MFNEAYITLTGFVATQPNMRETKSGKQRLHMRVAWTPRRLDHVTGEWRDGSTSFLTVYVYRRAGENAATCLRKGDPIVVHGKLNVREYEDKNGARRNVVEVDASSVGHDLSWGVAQFQRVRPQTGLTAAQYQQIEGGADGSQAAGDAEDRAFASLAAAAESDDADDADTADDVDQDAVDAMAEEVATAVAPF
jgi:single-strand DNA-binding protein